MLTENRNYLRINNRDLLNQLNELAGNFDEVIIEESKSGLPTLKIKQQAAYNYIHSKYDPKSEANRLVENFKLEDNKKHILLFGFGLGYHYEELKLRYPQVSFTIYEPSIHILNSTLNTKSLEKIFKDKAIRVITKNNLKEELPKIETLYNNEIQLFTLPFYKKHYKDELNELYELLVSNLKNKKSNLVTNISFQKRWTINAIKNMPKVIDTPNIFRNIDQKKFTGKPAIIVAAGPSLDYEYENLRYIKENGLAYIFSVGSAINSLIEKNIYPDAACTYDPTERNQIVFEKLKERKITEIPLIFGSTVGYKTIENYPGKMFHMITNQDSVAPYLLNDDKDLKIVRDAPSIAVVTFQLLANLGFKQIILVGQNLAYQQEKMYAGGIDYAPDSINKKLISIEDVNGGKTLTDESFNKMRQQLELYISSVNNIKVFNTTKGGAKIKGAPFVTLENLIEENLKEKSVESTWHQANAMNNYNNLDNRLESLSKTNKEMNALLEDTKKILAQCKTMSASNVQSIEKKLAKFDKLLKKLKNNKYYITFIGPMVRVQTEQLVNYSKIIKLETDIKKKVSLIEKYFGSFLTEIENHIHFVEPYVEEMIDSIKKGG